MRTFLVCASSLLLLSVGGFAQTSSTNVESLKQEIQQLREENARLRQMLTEGGTESKATTKGGTAAAKAAATTATPVKPLFPASGPTPKPDSATSGTAAATATASASAEQPAYWLSKSKKRHNSKCRFFGTGAGAPCGPNDGTPCGVCGG